jgi:hypothetical protein
MAFSPLSSIIMPIISISTLTHENTALSRLAAHPRGGYAIP